jgi:hypothetical protein
MAWFVLLTGRLGSKPLLFDRSQPFGFERAGPLFRDSPQTGFLEDVASGLPGKRSATHQDYPM